MKTFVDPMDDFNKNCKKHKNEEELIWLCLDCKKFQCTRCYAKEHKKCENVDLVENIYQETITKSENNIGKIDINKKELCLELELTTNKLKSYIDNNPFDTSVNFL